MRDILNALARTSSSDDESEELSSPSTRSFFFFFREDPNRIARASFAATAAASARAAAAAAASASLSAAEKERTSFASHASERCLQHIIDSALRSGWRRTEVSYRGPVLDSSKHSNTVTRVLSERVWVAFTTWLESIQQRNANK